jgi:glycerol-3-phosphate acyltransferase PlsY
MAILLLLISFLLGAVPFGLVLSRYKSGVDLRTMGSGNIGATNVARTLGLKMGLMTLALDLAKGLAAVLAARLLFETADTLGLLLPSLAGLAAFLGHIFSPFLKFKGGKGVATALGVCLGLTPWAVPPALAVFVIVVVAWGYVSAGSLSAAITVPPAAWLLGYPWYCWGTAALMVAVVFIRHRENIGRLLKGQENKWRKAK